MDDRLYRSRDERMIAGVAGGLAERLDLDPSLVRIIWAVLVLPTGFLALLVYVVMAIVVPEESADARLAPTAPTPTGDAAGAGAAASGPWSSAPSSSAWAPSSSSASSCPTSASTSSGRSRSSCSESPSSSARSAPRETRPGAGGCRP